MPMSAPYFLLTAAYNEEAHIVETIEAVLSQTLRPRQWVIVSDGSTDRTDEIIHGFAAKFGFIQLCRREKDSNHGYASKVMALQAGLQLLDVNRCQYLGHLDADVSFSSSYFGDLVSKFGADSTLGIAGGLILDKMRGEFCPRKRTRLNSVAGAVQFFRRECYQDIGDLPAIEWGGEDWFAEIKAKMCGWQVKTFPDLEVHHNRSTATADGLLRGRWRLGLRDYSLGSHPLFELGKCALRLHETPVVAGALLRLTAFLWSYLRRHPRAVSAEVVRYLQREQIQRFTLWKHGDKGLDPERRLPRAV